jgi:GT2 family glycosyltransferase
VNESPKVSAIIANWNGAHHLRICLPSLHAQTYKSVEIIVADNGSSDDSEQVTREFGATWLPLGRNIGLAPALNRGAAIAKGDKLLFVNNDMRFDPGFVSALVRVLESDASIFATDGMQFNWDGSTRTHLATRLAKTKTVAQSAVELVPGLYFYPQEQSGETPVFMASAACMLTRGVFFDKLHGFDDRLPLGYEDVEICWRAWLHNWKVVYVPDAVCWHRVGSSARSGEGARLGFRGVLTGRLLLATKLLPTKYAIRTWLVSLAGIFKDLRKSQWQFAKDRITILAQMAGLVPKLLREKKMLFAEACTSPEEHLRLLLSLTDKRESAKLL